MSLCKRRTQNDPYPMNVVNFIFSYHNPNQLFCIQLTPSLSLLILISYMSHKAILISLLFCLSLNQTIIDFSHTDSIQKTITAKAQSYQISITPSHKSDYLLFPEACSLSDFLSSQTALENHQFLLIQEQKQMEKLKQKIKQLLKLSELIKTAKNHIQSNFFVTKNRQVQNPHRNKIFFLTKNNLLQQLQILEFNLKAVNLTIKNMVGNLSQLISHEINRTKQSSFDSIRLTFQLKISQARLLYLESLRNHSSSSSHSNFEPLVISLFADLQEQITREKRQLNRINDLLSNYSDREQLKLRISNLESQRDGINMMIKEKESCDEKRMEIFNRENKKQLDKIISELKQLKEVESQGSNFCEGVARSLEKQLKKILKVYNYSFSCSEGLSDLKTNRLAIQIQLQRLKKGENDIDYDLRTEKLKRYFQDQDELHSRLIDEIYSIKLTQHTMNLSALDGQIRQAKSIVKKISYQLQHPPETQKVEIDYERIKTMISQIEQDQNEYCQLKEEYLEKYRKYDIQVRSLEHQTSIAKASQEVYQGQVSQVRQLEGQFRILRSEVQQLLQ